MLPIFFLLLSLLLQRALIHLLWDFILLDRLFNLLGNRFLLLNIFLWHRLITFLNNRLL